MNKLIKNSDFKQWLFSLKKRIRQTQIKAAIRVNDEMLRLYWDLGHDISVRQMDSTWGSSFFAALSQELKAEFPEMAGFSETNLRYCKYFYEFYAQDNLIHQQLVDELIITEKAESAIHPQLGDELQVAECQDIIIHPQLGDELITHQILLIPWGHHKLIITKCKNVKEALFYVKKTIENGWSRASLMNWLETDLYKREGKSLNNFDRFLPEEQSDLAKEIIKDPYNFDFLTLSQKYKERELENALETNISKFLLELGVGFAFVGRQVPIKVGEKELFIDMLFYHLKLRCYVVLELKAGEFDAAFMGQLGVYVSAVNHQLRTEHDKPTLGLLVCKNKDNVLAQYALESSSQPIGISEYELSKLLPENFKSALPSIEEIENELRDKN